MQSAFSVIVFFLTAALSRSAIPRFIASLSPKFMTGERRNKFFAAEYLPRNVNIIEIAY